ncbi:BPSL0761 family protein, partial [Pseudomonas aeruginosa]|uniref:BPSL0761 family protein n=1 Tax=Pseudomonas aeruginosa TaxID=287 RepID=UPI00267678BB
DRWIASKNSEVCSRPEIRGYFRPSLTRDFLVALSRDNALPEKVRHDAKFLLRHYPTRDDVILAGKIEEQAESMPLEALGPVFSSSLT